ncbi:MAG: purine-nucleoside phosphorylase [Desulfobacteraceae bacterium]|nr:MAG: purine-nucleoside phosphorylase [Desulfobacteraceae bacterium]
MLKRLQDAAAYLNEKINGLRPQIGIITGTGLGDITALMGLMHRIPYSHIPHFPIPTTESHRGNLLFGETRGKRIVAMEGRLHAYEGYSPDEVTFPVRLMSLLGVKHLFISSAAGGLNPNYEAGNFMAITDHINFTGLSALCGPNLELFGPRFPDMSRAYDRDLIRTAEKIACQQGIHLHKGVYIGVLGPNLETPAETRFYRNSGADAIGMSTVLEATVGVHCGMRILAIVVITNVNLPDCMGETSLEMVIDAAKNAAPALALLWNNIIAEISV